MTEGREHLEQERNTPPVKGCRCNVCTGVKCQCFDEQIHYPHDDPDRGLKEALWVAHKYIYEQLNDVDSLHPVLRTTLLACVRYAFSGYRIPQLHDAEQAARHWLHVHHGEAVVDA